MALGRNETGKVAPSMTRRRQNGLFGLRTAPPGTGKRPRLVSQWLVCEKFGLGTIEGLLHRIDGEIVRKAVPVTTVVVGPSPVKLEAGSSDGSSQPKSKGIEIRISLTPRSVAIGMAAGISWRLCSKAKTARRGPET